MQSCARCWRQSCHAPRLSWLSCSRAVLQDSSGWRPGATGHSACPCYHPHSSSGSQTVTTDKPRSASGELGRQALAGAARCWHDTSQCCWLRSLGDGEAHAAGYLFACGACCWGVHRAVSAAKAGPAFKALQQDWARRRPNQGCTLCSAAVLAACLSART